MLSKSGRMSNPVDFTTEDMKDTNGAIFYYSSAIQIFLQKTFCGYLPKSSNHIFINKTSSAIELSLMKTGEIYPPS
jgi:hypothetical protein